MREVGGDGRMEAGGSEGREVGREGWGQRG